MENTTLRCPSSVLTHAPVSTSHSRTVLSWLPEASCFPSGLKHTDLTQSPCPSSVLTHAPVSTSHSRTVLSALPDATSRPSGLKHTESTPRPDGRAPRA